MEDKLLSIQEAADVLGVATKTLRRWEARGKLVPQRTTGNQRRYTREQLDAFLASQQAAMPEQEQDLNTITDAEPILHSFSLISIIDLVKSRFPRLGYLPAYVASLVLAFLTIAGLIILVSSASILADGGILSGLEKTSDALRKHTTGLRGFIAQMLPAKAKGEKDTDQTATVLAANKYDPSFIFTVNVPSKFKDLVEISSDLNVSNYATISGGLTAPNVLYSVTAGSGIAITDGQTPTITNTGVLSIQGLSGAVEFTTGDGLSVEGLSFTNTDPGSAQNIFKNFIVGSDTITANNNDDSLEFIAGDGIEISADDKTITFTGLSPGWVDDGTVVRLATATDFVGIGTANPSAFKLQVAGSVGPDLNNTYDLGSDALQWRNLYLSGDLFVSGRVAGFLQRNNGVVSPVHSSDDLAIGGIATNSAKFQVFGNTGAASMSGSLTFNTSGSIQTTNNQTLTLGGNTTGNIVLTDPTTFSSSLTLNSETFSDFTGDGLTLIGGALTLDLLTVIDGTGNTSSYSGLELEGGSNNSLTLLQGCSNNQLLKWDFTNKVWQCANDLGGSAATINVQEGGVTYTGVDTVDFSQLEFNVSQAATVAYITLDPSLAQFRIGNGATYLGNTTTDLLIGGNATASAKFGLLNVNSGTPTASISANGTNSTYLTASGNLATTAMQSLTIGGSTTGSITLQPGTGNINTTSNINLAAGTALLLNGSNLLSGTTLGTSVVNSSLTSVGTITSGVWNGTVIGAQYGGTGLNTSAATGVPTISSGTWSVSSALSAVLGGTGHSSYSTGDMLYASNGTTLSRLAIGSAGQVLGVQGGLPTWINTSSLNYWQRADGTVIPLNITDDLLLGGLSTSSAKFAFINTTSGTPTASLSAGVNSGAYLTADGKLATEANQTLTIGDTATTGNVVLNPSGNIGIGTTTPAAKLDVNGNAVVSGNVAIGHSVPGTQLDIQGSIYAGPNAGSTAGRQILTSSSNNAVLYQYGSGGTVINELNTNGDSYVTGGKLGIGTSAPLGVLHVTGASAGKALAIFNESGDQNILTASASGTTRLTLDRSGNLNIIGGQYQIGGANVLSSTTLGTTVVNSSLTSVGTITTGVWNGTAIGAQYGGTGINSSASSGVATVDSGTWSINATLSPTLGGTGLNTSASTGIASISSGTWSVLSAITAALGGTGDDTSATTGVPYISSGNWLYEATLDETRGGTGLSSYTTGDLIYASGSNTLANLAIGAEGRVLAVSGGVPAWTDASTLGTNYFQRNSGALSPLNITDDLLLGGIGSDSAKFAFLNNAGGTPTASISGNIVLNSTGSIQTTNNRALTIGGSTTGSITIAALNGSGPLALQAGSLSINGTPGTTSGSNTCVSVTNGIVTGTGICEAGAGGSKWQLNNGVISPFSSTLDLALGGTSTNSAKFAVTNILTGTPIASLSAGTNSGAFLTADGNLATQAMQTLAVGGSTTGNITFNSGANIISFADAITAPTAVNTINGVIINSGTISNATWNGNVVGVQYGGTGTNTFTSNGLLYGNGTGAVQVTAAGTNGQLLLGVTAGAPAFATMGGDASINNAGSVTISDNAVDGSDIALGSDATGDIMYYNGTDWVRLGIGAGDQVLTVNGGIPSWQTTSAVNYWQRANGALAQTNITDDLLLGATATTSAKFAFYNVASGTPTASLSAGINSGLYLTADGTLATQAMQTLAVGGSATGNITFNSGTNVISFADAITAPAAVNTINGIVINGGTISNATWNGNIIGVQYGGTGANTLTSNGVIYGNGTGAVQATTAGTNGQLLLGVTGSGPAFATMTGDASISNAGALMIADNAVDGSDIALGSDATGDLMYYNGTDWVRLGVGSSGEILTVSGGNPAWLPNNAVNYWQRNNGALTSANITDDLLLGATATTSAKFAFFNVASGTPTASLSAGINSGLYLTADGTLATQAMQTLAVGGSATGNITFNSGTNVISFADAITAPTATNTINGIIINSGTISNATWNGNVVGVQYGGTGTNTLTSNGVLFGNGTGAVQATTAGTNGQLLLGVSSGNPTFATMTGDASISNAGALTIADNAVDGTDIALGSDATGDIMYYNGTDWVRLGVGAGDQVLTVSGGIPSWQTTSVVNYWQRANGALAQTNITDDLLLGATATTSAKFAFYNVASGTPTASLSAGINSGLYLTANGTLATNAMQALTIGGSSTGAITLDAGSGGITLSDATTLSSTLTFNSETFNDLTGNGLTVASNALTLLLTTSGGTGGTTSNSGLEVGSSGLSLLKGCSDGQILKWDDTNSLWGCGPDAGAGGGSSKWTETGNVLYPNTISRQVGIGTQTSGDIISSLYVTRNTASGALGKALAVFNQTEDQDLLTASYSGTTKFTVDRNGNMGIAGSAASSSNYITAPNFVLNTSGQITTGAWQATAIAAQYGGTGDDTSGTTGVPYISSGNWQYEAALDETRGGTGLATYSTGDLIYASDANTLARRAIGGEGDILTVTGGVPTWSSAGAAGLNYWQRNNGTVAPINITDDLLLGATATTSAKFAFYNVVGSGTPTASISAGTNSGTFLTAAGNLATQAMQTLTLGGSSTGSIVLDAGTGSITLSDAVSASSTLDVNGIATFVANVNANGGFDVDDVFVVADGGVLTTTANANLDAGFDVDDAFQVANGGALTTSQLATFNGTLDANDVVTLGDNGQGVTIDSNTWDVTAAGAASDFISLVVDNLRLDNNTFDSTSGDITLDAFDGDIITPDRVTIGDATAGPSQLNVIGTQAGKALVVFDETGTNQNILTASASGTTVLNLDRSGNLTIEGQLADLSQTALTVNDSLNLVSGNTFQINGTNVLSNNTLGAGVTASSLTSVGTLTSGTWNATAIGAQYGGTGINTSASTGVPTINGGTWSVSAALSAALGGTGDDTSSTTGVPYISSGNWQYEAALDETRGGTGISSYTAGDLIYASGANTLTTLAGGAGNEGKILSISGGVPTWITSGSLNFWQRNNGTVAPVNITDDLLVGGIATTSAKFAFFNNIGAGTPTASISAQNGAGQAVSIDAGGNIQTLRDATLTLGGNTTGNITLSPLNGNGSVTSTGNMNLASGKVYQINGTTVLSNNTLGSGVTASSLTSVGTIATGVWNGTAIGAQYGGTGINTSASTGVPTISGGTWSVSAALSAALGGTGDDTSSTTGVPYISSGNWLYEAALDETRGGTGLATYATGDLIYASGADTLARRAIGADGSVLTVSGGVPTWTAAGNINYWQRNSGTVAPVNITDDLLLGGIATTSAKFAFFNNIGAGTPTASISAQNGAGQAVSIDAGGNIQTLRDATLTLGGSTTGNITLSPLNGNGSVTSTGNMNLASGKVYQINGTTVLSNNTLGSGVTASSLTSVGTIATGVWNGTAIGAQYGGTGINTSASTGVATVNSGTWSIAAALSAALGGTGDDTSGTTGVPYISAGNWQYEAALDETRGGTGISSYTAGDLIYASGANTLTTLAGGAGNEGKILTISGGVPAWTASSNFNLWQRNSGAIAPLNITDDLLIGGIATSSAKFQIFGLTGNATTSGTFTFDTAGSIQTTKNQTLTIGGNTTGTVIIDSAIGAITLADATTINSNLTVAGTTGITFSSTGGVNFAGGTISDTSDGVDINDDLEIAGTTTLGDASGDGVTVNAASWTFTNDTNFALSGGINGLSFDTSTLSIDATDDLVGIGTTAPIGKLTVSGAVTGKALAIFDETGTNQNILSASASGTTVFNLDRSGNLTIEGQLADLSQTALTVNDSLNLVSGNTYQINGTNVLSSTTLGAGVTGSSLTSVGTLTSGTWQATAIGAQYGGTGINTSASTGVATVNSGTWSILATLTSALGGTGDNTSATNGVPWINNGDWQYEAALDETRGGTGQSTITQGDLLYGSGANTLSKLAVGSANTVLVSNGSVPSWSSSLTLGGVTPSGTTGSQGWWQRANGALAPYHVTDDLLLGATATTSAKFAFKNVLTGTPTASISAGTAGGVYITATGSLATTAKQTLILGDSATGNIILNGGNVGIGTTTPSSLLSVNGTAEATSFISSIFQLDASNGLTVSATNGNLRNQANGYVSIDTDNSSSNAFFAVQKDSATAGSGSELFRVQEDGRVGMLTSAPDAALEINHASGTNLRLTYNDSNGSATNYTDFTLGSDGDLTINSTGSNIIIANGDTLAIGGNTGAAYNAIAASLTNVDIADDDADLFIGDELEVNGAVRFDATAGNITFSNYSSCTALETDVNGVLQCGSDDGGSGVNTYWQLNNGTISPFSNTLDVLIGQTATTSAKFGFINVNNGTPTATIAGNLTLDSAGTIATTKNQSLTIGGSETGNITLSPLGGSGSVTSTGNMTLSSGKVYQINGTTVLSNNTLGSGVTASSLTSVGTITTGVWNGTAVGAQYGGTGINTSALTGVPYINAGTWNVENAVSATRGGTGFSSYSVGDLLYANSTTTLAKRAIGVDGQVLSIASGVPTWADSSSIGVMQRVSGSVIPLNITDDLLLGATSTASARLGFINIAAGTPTIQSSTDLTLDSTADINLDADGADILFKDAGATFATFTNSTTDLTIDAAGGNILSSDVLNIGGAAAAAYNFFAASTAGNSTPDGAGDLYIQDELEVDGTIRLNNQTYTFPSSAGTSGYALTTNGAGTLSWTDPVTIGSNWNTGSGTIYPKITTQDLLLGGTATSSAKFAVLNMNANTPTASLSAGTNSGAYLTAAGNLATEAFQTLTLGGSTTGNIVLNAMNSTGRITANATNLTLSGTTTITGTSLTTITGGATAIDFTEFDVNASTGSVTIDDGGNAGALLVEGTNLDINSLDFVGVGTLTTTGTLTLTPSTTLNLNSTGDMTLDSSTDIILDADGADVFLQDAGVTFATFTNSSTDLTLDAAGGNILSSDVLNIGGAAAAAYNFFATATTGVSTPDGTGDLYIQDELEVDGTIRLNNQTYTFPGSAGTNGYALTTNGAGTLSWTDPVTIGSNWNTGSGTIYPKITTQDLLLGGTATSSAKLAVLNMVTGNPTLQFGGAGQITSTSNNSITITPGGTGDTIIATDADSNFQINASAAPGVDVAVINNDTVGATTTGIDGLQIDYATAGTTASADNAALRINVTSNNSGATTTLEGIYIGNLTSAEANATEYALRIGTGWDTGILIESGAISYSASNTTRPTRTIKLSPEYAGAVLTASNSATITGSMTSDASHSANFRTYYEWDSSSSSLQDYTVAVRVELPQDFSAWSTSNAITIEYNTEKAVAADDRLDVYIYNPGDSTSNPVYFSTSNIGTAKTWSTVTVDDGLLNDNSGSDWDAAGEEAVIYLKLHSRGNFYTQVGDIELSYQVAF